jgi:hypothetical protein
VEAPRNESTQPGDQEKAAAGSGSGGSGFGVRDSQSDDPSSSARPESRTPNPVSSPNSEPPTLSAKPKRKYTVSEKSRNASLQNLQKANLAPHELKYRLTPRRLAACFSALEKAVAELRRLDSPHYGLGFKRGTHCASLLRSLALAGEKREDYEEHLKLFHEAFPTVDERGRKLVQATAEAVWRRLRAFRGQGRWELYAVAALLVELITERERAAAAADPSAAASGSTGPVDPILDPSGPARASRLGLDLVGLLMQTNVDQEAHRLNLRIERLLRGLVPPEDGQPLVQDAKPHPSEASYDQKPAAALGNPLCSAPQVEAALKHDREQIKGTDEWQKDGGTAGGPATGPASGIAGGSDQRSGVCESAADLAHRGGLMRLLHQVRRGGGAGMDFSRLEGAEGKALWIDLWLRAFGIDDCQLTIDDCKTVKKEPSALGPLNTKPTGEPGDVFQSSISRPAILAFAELTWERVQMFRRHSDKETAQLREALQARVLAQSKTGDCFCPAEPIATCPADQAQNSKFETRPPDADSSRESPGSSYESPAPGSDQSSVGNQQSPIPEPSSGHRQSALAVLGALAVYTCVGAIAAAGKEIEAAYYRVLVALYGELPGFHYFKPKKPTMDDHMAEASRLAFELLAMKDGPLHKQIKWRGGSRGRDPGGGP